MSWIENLKKWWTKCITYHPPRTEEQRNAHARVNEIIAKAGEDLLEVCPASEQLENVLVKLQEARMWANASLAIHVNNPNPEK